MTSRDVEGSRTIVAVIVRLPYELSMVPADKIIARGEDYGYLQSHDANKRILSRAVALPKDQ